GNGNGSGGGNGNGSGGGNGNGSGGGNGNGSGGGDGNGSDGGKRPLTKEEIEALPQAPNHKVATPEAVEAWIDECIKQIPDLTHEELMAVYNYSGPQYKLINGWLRDPSMAVPADIPKTVETLNKFLDRLPPHNEAVFRGTKVPQHIIDEAIHTGVYRDPAFFSTTTKSEVAEFFMNRLNPEPGETRVLFEIQDASGSNIRPMSMYATQDEILFKSGVDFEVVDYDKLSDGSYTIKLRQRE
ncbi:MAG: ADP-ribosyltransferase, partial [Actinomyces sp.]|nr:ADP-ribosyltransferase [Actinomyces sp.]